MMKLTDFGMDQGVLSLILEETGAGPWLSTARGVERQGGVSIDDRIDESVDQGSDAQMETIP